MSVTAKSEGKDNSVSVKVDGRFDFSIQREFRMTYKDNNTPGVIFKVDLGSTEYMDSSALGMLLLMKEHCEKIKGTVVICNPSSVIRQILETANFDTLFKIEA